MRANIFVSMQSNAAADQAEAPALPEAPEALGTWARVVDLLGKAKNKVVGIWHKTDS